MNLSLAVTNESTLGVYLQNKNALEKLFAKRKVKLYEQPDVLNEDNIIDNLD
jgi:hypothetical protein